MHPALIFLGLLALCLIAIIPFVYVSIKQSGEARLLQPAPKESHPGAHRLTDMHRPWASHFRFEWIGGYQFRGLDRRFIAAWRHEHQPVFLLVQQIKGATHYELISAFNREQTLTTTSLNAIVPPIPPRPFVQRFPDSTLTDLFRHHTEAHDFLLNTGHAQLVPHPLRVDRAVIDVMARTHAYVTALSVWPLRSLAWALLGPRQARNKSVPEQLAFAPPPVPSEAPERPAKDEEAEDEEAIEVPRKRFTTGRRS